ncbi:MAG TPA: DUF1254 domain-containing protein [Acidimicrobiales bacterium]|nr:DUF1254 domain-containing protein [Acidimicrobiales bacterium]
MANRDHQEPIGQEHSAPSASSASLSAAKPRTRWKVYLLTFTLTMLVVWGAGTYTFIYFFPRLLYNRVENTVVNHGLGGSDSTGIPVNTVYTMPALASPTRSNSLQSTGNRDTLYTAGVLDLSKGPQVLHVPDMAGRYYAVQFTDPWGTVFAYVGRRTTGTKAGDYLISGPGWHGRIPKGITKQIVAPNNTVLLIGRTLVKGEGDLAAAYELARQIRVTPLSQWHRDQ